MVGNFHIIIKNIFEVNDIWFPWNLAQLWFLDLKFLKRKKASAIFLTSFLIVSSGNELTNHLVVSESLNYQQGQPNLKSPNTLKGLWNGLCNFVEAHWDGRTSNKGHLETDSSSLPELYNFLQHFKAENRWWSVQITATRPNSFSTAHEWSDTLWPLDVTVAANLIGFHGL